MGATGRDAKADFRMTPQRAAILEAVKGPTAISRQARSSSGSSRRYPSIAYGTVYRTLHLFAERGLILEFPFGDEASRFDKRVDQHDHVHCIRLRDARRCRCAAGVVRPARRVRTDRLGDHRSSDRFFRNLSSLPAGSAAGKLVNLLVE